MIVIVDYGMGNLGSIKNMLKKAGFDCTISSKSSDIESADKLILPGVGHFDNGMKNLEQGGLIKSLNRKVLEEKIPVLGICLGMQLMTKKSEEGRLPGLGWIDGEVIRFSFRDNSLKIPHMGWNTVDVKKSSHLFDGMYEYPRFYFVHSYYVRCNEKDVLTTTHHGIDFVSSFEAGNIRGFQFHPEKSHRFGMKLLENFARVK